MMFEISGSQILPRGLQQKMLFNTWRLIQTSHTPNDEYDIFLLNHIRVFKSHTCALKSEELSCHSKCKDH